MPRSQPIPTTSHQRAPLSSKELDLLILAGCSCLLTVLCHPSPTTLQSATTSPAAPVQTIAQIRNTTATIGPLHVTLPPDRESVVEEDEDA